ncbi:MAG: VOC family protein [Candidatus Hodarchaeota archaeon]
MMKIHHIGYAVRDLKVSVPEFLKLGYKNLTETIFDEIRNVAIQFMKNDSYLIELIAPLNDNSPVDNILSKIGNSPYHICYEVDDLFYQIKRFSDEGYLVIEDAKEALGIDNQRVAFLFSSKVGLIELIEAKR